MQNGTHNTTSNYAKGAGTLHVMDNDNATEKIMASAEPSIADSQRMIQAAPTNPMAAEFTPDKMARKT